MGGGTSKPNVGTTFRILYQLLKQKLKFLLSFEAGALCLFIRNTFITPVLSLDCLCGVKALDLFVLWWSLSHVCLLALLCVVRTHLYI